MVEVLLRSPVGRILAPRFAGAQLVAPELLDVEVASALRRAVVRGIRTLPDVLSATDVLRVWPIRRVPHRSLIAASTRWWPNVTAYDAVYLAVAVAHDAQVLTVDGPLSRAPISDVVVENVTVQS